MLLFKDKIDQIKKEMNKYRIIIDNKIENHNLNKKTIKLSLCGIVLMTVVIVSAINLSVKSSREDREAVYKDLSNVVETYKNITNYYNAISDEWKNAKDLKYNELLAVREAVKNNTQLQQQIEEEIAKINDMQMINRQDRKKNDIEKAKEFVDGIIALSSIATNPLGYKDLREYQFNWDKADRRVKNTQSYFTLYK